MMPGRRRSITADLAFEYVKSWLQPGPAGRGPKDLDALYCLAEPIAAPWSTGLLAVNPLDPAYDTATVAQIAAWIGHESA